LLLEILVRRGGILMTVENPLPLKEHMRRQRLTVRAMAQKAGVSTETITRISKGKSTHPTTQLKIAEALNVSPDAISEFHIE
jgi:DNA-binding XRE family transcriptional regulator